MRNSCKPVLATTLLILFLVDFHHLSIYPISWTFGFVGQVIHLAFIFILLKGKIWDKGILCKRLFLAYIILAFFNMVTCLYFRNQSLLLSFNSWAPFFMVFYYFCFRTWNKGVLFWEKVLENCYFVILFLYTLQYAFLNLEILKLDTSREYLEFESRVRIYSDGILTLGYLYCLNKFLVYKKKQYLLWALVGFFLIFLQGFRSLIVMGTITSVIMIFRVYKMPGVTLKFVIGGLLVVVTALQSSIVQDKVKEIIARNESSNFNNEDYVRVVEINYFYNNFFLNDVEMILGAGKTPYGSDDIYNGKYPSKYSEERCYLANEFHFYTVDLGYLGLSWEAGIPFTIVILLLTISLLRFKVNKEYYYIGLYSLYMLLIGMTYPHGIYQRNLINLALVFTIAEIVHRSYVPQKV